MRNPAQKMTPAFMKTVTMRGNRRLENQIRLMERVRDDTERDKRLASQQCRGCYYGERVVTHAMTEQACMSCDAIKLFNNSDTDVLCQPCAVQGSLCKHCGADIDLNVDREDWPEPTHAPEEPA